MAFRCSVIFAARHGGRSTSIGAHVEQGLVAIHPKGPRSVQVAHHTHSVGAISASDTYRGPRILGACDGAMTYSVLDHESALTLAVEEAPGVVASGVSACSEPLWFSRMTTGGRLAVAAWI